MSHDGSATDESSTGGGVRINESPKMSTARRATSTRETDEVVDIVTFDARVARAALSVRGIGWPAATTSCTLACGCGAWAAGCEKHPASTIVPGIKGEARHGFLR